MTKEIDLVWFGIVHPRNVFDNPDKIQVIKQDYFQQNSGQKKFYKFLDGGCCLGIQVISDTQENAENQLREITREIAMVFDGRTALIDFDDNIRELYKLSVYASNTDEKTFARGQAIEVYNLMLQLCCFSSIKLRELDEQKLEAGSELSSTGVMGNYTIKTKEGTVFIARGILATHNYLLNNKEDLFNELDIRFRRYSKRLKIKNNKKINHNGRKHLTKSIRHEVFKKYDYRCIECGISKNDTVLEIDHKISVAQGGSDELDNLQLLCRSCNRAKSDRAWEGGMK